MQTFLYSKGEPDKLLKLEPLGSQDIGHEKKEGYNWYHIVLGNMQLIVIAILLGETRKAIKTGAVGLPGH